MIFVGSCVVLFELLCDALVFSKGQDVLVPKFVHVFFSLYFSTLLHPHGGPTTSHPSSIRILGPTPFHGGDRPGIAFLPCASAYDQGEGATGGCPYLEVIVTNVLFNLSPYHPYVLLGCPRKLGSMVSKWVITPIYPIYK